MNLEQFYEAVPEGFHDSEIVKIEQDFGRREVRLLMNLCWAGPDAPRDTPEMRQAWVTFQSVRQFIVEPPSSSNAYLDDVLQITNNGVADTEFRAAHASLYVDIPDDGVAGWLYVNRLAGMIYWAASDILLEFLD